MSLGCRIRRSYRRGTMRGEADRAERVTRAPGGVLGDKECVLEEAV